MKEELEALERLRNTLLAEGYWQDVLQDVAIIEKALKTLEIIKEERVNVEYIKACENYEQYRTICSYWNEITIDEFYLLREVLL